VQLDRKWFLKIKNDKLTAQQVFSIDNIEHRRVAYEFMDKLKMKSLKDFTIIDSVENDGYNYPMKVISFKAKNVTNPLVFFNCHCPSTGREYYLQIESKTCIEAKEKLFGVSNVEFIKEW
jgi:hypothetical protein